VGIATIVPVDGWTYLILGPPRTKKTHQQIVRRRDGTPFIMSAKTSKSWEAKAILQLQAQRRGKTFDVMVNCRALIYRDKRIGDAVNYYQAIADALEEAGVVTNDRLIAAWDGSRLLHDTRP